MITRGFGIEGGGLGGTVFVDGIEVRVEPDLVVLLEPEDVAVGLVNQIDVTLADFEGPPPPIPIAYLLSDEFTTDDPAPLDASRNCEPGPGTMVKTLDLDENCYIQSGAWVLDQITGEGQPSYRFQTVSQFDHDAGNALYAVIKNVGQTNSWVQVGSYYASNGLPGQPRLYETGLIDGIGNTIQIWEGFDQDVLNKIWIIFRSVGAFLIINNDLRWVDPTAPVSPTNRALGVRSAYDLQTWSVEISDGRMLNLPAQTQEGIDWSVWDADFSTVLVSYSSLPTGIEANDLGVDDFSWRLIYEHSATNSATIYQRFQLAPLDGVMVQFLSNNNISISNYVDGAFQNIALLTNQMPIYGSYTFDCILEGSDLTLFQDNVQIFTTDQARDAGLTQDMYCQSGEAGNSDSIVVNPYPSHGIATDRVICPLYGALDWGFGHATMLADSLIYIRGIEFSAGQMETIVRGLDSDNFLNLQIWNDGTLALREKYLGTAVSRINGGAGTVSEGDDVVLILDGAYAEVFVDNTSIGSYGSLQDLTSTGVMFYATLAGVERCASIEFWPRDVSALLPSELV